MGELLRFAAATADDVTAVRQLTRDVARVMGLGALEQTKLATAVSELSRRALASAGASAILFVHDDAVPERPRLVVAVDNAGPRPGATGVARQERRAANATGGLDLPGIRGLVDDFDVVTGPDGQTRVDVAIRLAPETSPAPDQIARAVAALRPKVSPLTLERRNFELADALTLLESQSESLATANGELQRVNKQLADVNGELALTNRGVLDLNIELEERASSLAASEARQRQLADQHAALAALGRVAVASRDSGALGREVVSTARQALGVNACAVLRLEPGGSRLQFVAGDGCRPACASGVDIDRQQAENLRSGRTSIIDLAVEGDRFPLPFPAGMRSAALVPVPTSGTTWGVLAACDSAAGRFGETAVGFMEAAAGLLASSIARTATEEAARHAGLHDALTGLPNRALLLQHMQGRLGHGHSHGHNHGQPDRRSKRTASRLAVLFVDLDGFKAVNDTLGHAAGDVVLVETAARLSRRIRPADVLARLGGDEFVVLCEVADEAAATALAPRLLDAFAEPFVIDRREIFLSGSAGLALADPGTDAGQVLADADIAMYRAKQTVGSAMVAFRPEMRGQAETESRLNNELQRALERRQLRAVYQPLVDLGTGAVRGVEALVRWRHPELGDVPAERTVATAERTGRAWEITCWVVGEAARAVASWNAEHAAHAPLRLAVNFTPLLLDDPARIEQFAAHVVESGLPLNLLDVELTETALAHPSANVLKAIAELRTRGVRLAMDDFGTGYSSLVSLVNLPFDVLKVDRSFVTPLDRGGDSVVVSAISGIARGRGLETVGEGVETEGQLRALIAAECDLGQGYLFSQPMEREELAELTAREPLWAEIVRQARSGNAGGVAEGLTHRPFPGGARVLVVEDNPADLELMRVLLGHAGHTMTAVADPAAFVAALQETQPDLVLMDLRLKGTSGFDLVEQAGAMLTMPVLAVTGYPQWVVDHDERARMFSGVVSKPVDPTELWARLDCLLAGSRPIA